MKKHCASNQKQTNIDSSNNICRNRRRAVFALSLGGGAAYALPNKWTKPIVDSVIMPAHAQTSIEDEDTPTSTPSTTSGTSVTPDA